ncbi:hypothetical protein BKD09_24415 [Bradyrhizobium japonicum]|uniref:Uncharacterized protein n=1 Tax=Bradyrhizobium japonicum TaxID=375 RepID=A0A1L3FE10_BRAJP|nr:hypothetical protein [Bradyrhizobium japonicum]APG11482.1 hypothetical protein BKD09_24415 [Bradyrhizobium japonicum]
MKRMVFKNFAIATSAIAFATLFTVDWSEQRGISLSVESAQARRLYVSPYPYSHYIPDQTGLPWYAVRAYYAGGPWCGAGGGTGYGTTVGVFGRASYTCYDGWDSYARLNGIGCTPGTLIKGGDGIMYVCQ